MPAKRNAAVSPRARLSAPLTLRVPKSPNWACTSTLFSSSTGRLVRTAITPPVVFLPNSVPCGPRSTSMASMSNISRLEVWMCGMVNSSSVTATGDSL